ncbi:conserved Plasmodium protein, unknown function [Plasmodium malariae]|uniref:Regulator of chromosome condensation n=1 Tax=Plasmodium malariae TaxID=5858 RepID=A0A1D3PCC9_PLAMA|nr:conserved Plasmodium protein, unknown function [Plasmodium malariae]SCN12950.1 conserved Plasmodium protein, unknown function [Plasmodium malariae]
MKNLSNVYLYKNNKLELIKELENVFIKKVHTCNNSLNVVLNRNNDSTYSTLIRLDDAADGSAATSTRSYVNISSNDTYDFNFMTRNLILYSFYKNEAVNENCQGLNEEKFHNESNVSHTTNSTVGRYTKNHSAQDSKNFNRILFTRNLKKQKDFFINEKNKVWKYKLDDNQMEEETRIKSIPINFEKIFFCSSQFYAINEEKQVFRWDTDETHKYDIIHDYNSRFVSYIHFSDKVKIENISCGQSHALFLSKNKNCYAFGRNDNYQVCQEKKIFYNTPILILLNKEKRKKVKYISAGHSHNLISTYQNEIYGWGNNMHSQLCSGDNFVKCPTLILNQNIWTDFIKKTSQSKKKKRHLLRKEKHKAHTGDATYSGTYNAEYCVACSSTNQGCCAYVKSKREDYRSGESYEGDQNSSISSKERSSLNVEWEKLKRINENYFQLRKFKNKNKFEIGKLCCGFSFSCILLKNKNCYIVGKNNCHEDGNVIKIPKKINKGKKIDDVFCNFFHIIVIDHLKIKKICPTIIHPNMENSIMLFFNFKVKNELNVKILLTDNNFMNKSKKKKKKKKNSQIVHPQKGNIDQNTEQLIYEQTSHSSSNIEDEERDKKEKKNTPTDIFFHFNYHNDIEVIPHFNPSSSFDVCPIMFYKKKAEYSISCQINRNIINKRLFLTLYNSDFSIKYNHSIILSNYEGKVRNIFPNNFALMQNIKLKIKINKAPIHVKSDYIYVLYHFTDDNKNYLYMFSKGRLNKKRTYIYTKMSFVKSANGCKSSNKHNCDNGNNDALCYHLSCASLNDKENSPSTIHKFTKCNVHYSFGYNFYKNYFPITIIKPDILNITPNIISTRENNVIININMLYLSKKFPFIHVILYNPHLQLINKKAYYNSDNNNYFFSTPLIPITLFKKSQLDFIIFNVFASYNNIEYSRGEILLTVSNI